MPNWSTSSASSPFRALPPLHLELAGRRWDRLVALVGIVALLFAPALVMQRRGSFMTDGWVLASGAGVLLALGAWFELKRLGWWPGPARLESLILHSTGAWSLTRGGVDETVVLSGSTRIAGAFILLVLRGTHTQRILLGPGDLPADTHRRLATRLHLRASLALPELASEAEDARKSDSRHVFARCRRWANFLWDGRSTNAAVNRHDAGVESPVRNAGQ